MTGGFAQKTKLNRHLLQKNERTKNEKSTLTNKRINPVRPIRARFGDSPWCNIR
jgi:hypothetical protein